MLVPFFAAEDSAPLAAEKLINIGPLPFTNSMLFGLIMAALTLGLFGLAARASQAWPKRRLAFYVESLVDLVYNLMSDSFGDRKKAARHFPLLLSLFVFILMANLSGLLPGVGSLSVNVNGEDTSLLRAFTTDLNSTLAIALPNFTSLPLFFP